MTREPVIRFYTDEACTEVLTKKTPLPLCEAGHSMIYDVYARNEGKLPLESWDIAVSAAYQVLRDEDDESKGYDEVPTTDLALVATPRPHRLEPGQKAHIRVRWAPSVENRHPIVWTIAAGGPYILAPYD